MNDAPAKAVGDAIAAVLELATNRPVQRSIDGVGRKTGATVVLVTYASAFETLWKCDRDLFRWLCVGGQLIVVWDGQPQASGIAADIRIDDVVTALDWAIAFVAEASSQGDSDGRPECAGRLWIVDVSSSRYPSAHAVKTFRRLRKSLPELLPWISIIGVDDIPSLVATVWSERLRPSANVDSSMFVSLWRHAVTDPAAPEDRHAIANVVGPQILLRSLGVKAPVPVPQVAALQRLLQSLGLISPARFGTAKEQTVVDRSDWSHTFGEVVVIDDMADGGWKAFVQHALNVRDDEMIVSTRADSDAIFGPDKNLRLLEYLKQSLADRSGRLSGLPLHGTRSPLVFLDLRLFSGSAASDRKQRFQEELLRLAQDCARHPEWFVWPVIDSSQLKSMREAGDPGRDDDVAQQISLSLLPRLLSLASPTTPLIIFSTATHRRVAELFRAHGNIIVEFTKPTFFGGPTGQVVYESIKKLRQAVASAVAIGKARISLEPLLSTTLPETHPIANAASVEIYFEESGHASGASTLTVGGLIAVYPTAGAARDLSRALRAKGYNWGADCDDPFVPAPSVPKRKAYFARGETSDPDVRTGLTEIDVLTRSLGITVTAFEVSAKAITEPGLLSWQGPDAVYRLLLSQALELFLFDWLPARQLAHVPVNVFVGTRMIADSVAALLGAQRRFGVDLRLTSDVSRQRAYQISPQALPSMWDPDKHDIGFSRGQGTTMALTATATLQNAGTKAVGLLAYGFSSDDVYPIVTDMFRRRQSSRSVEKAIGVFLAYHDGVPVQEHRRFALPRQIHYAADWVVSKRHCVPDHWWSNGFREPSNDRLQDILRCSRAVDEHGRTVDAIRLFGVIGAGGERDVSAARFVGPRVGQRAQAMSGEQFIRLTRVLAQ